MSSSTLDDRGFTRRFNRLDFPLLNPPAIVQIFLRAKCRANLIWRMRSATVFNPE